MYSISDLKKEVLIQLDGVPYRIAESQHSSMGRGGAVVRTKLKNLLNGAVVERTFRPSEKIQPAEIERQQVQYLYSEGSDANFMDQSTYEQVSVSFDILGDQARFMAEGATVTLLYFQDKPIGLDMPNSVYLKVTHTEPGLKGDTASTTLKPCTVETGVNVNVPLFINEGDVIKVDTRTGAYLERQK